MNTELMLWIIFGVVIAAVMALDLGVFHRKSEEQSLRQAGLWTIFWVLLALGFNASIYFMRGPQAALEFFTGYLVEWSLSMDNVFVFALIFTCFCVPKAFQHKVLFWGILGAIVMRLTFILLGSALLHRFEWVLYVFGVIVLAAGIRMFRHKPEEIHPERNPILKLACRYLRVTPGFVEDKFFVRENGLLMATPLFLVLLVVEATDVVFAVDSVPAIFAITKDPFIVFTSNVFAIMGLRALYFLLAGIIGKFRYLSEGLALVLCFVGTKMLLSDVYHLPTAISLGVILGILGGAIVLSVLRPLPPECAVECPISSDEAGISCDIVQKDE
ncbi:MAG: TerC family protein [Armatimonadota bacterium]